MTFLCVIGLFLGSFIIKIIKNKKDRKNNPSRYIY
jgi:hypothetical protein